MPLISRLIKGCGYNSKAHVAAFRLGDTGVIVKPREVIITHVENEAAACKVMDRLINLIKNHEGENRIGKKGFSNRQLISSKKQEDWIMEIKVLGPGCARCQQTEKTVKEAVAEAGLDIKVEKISNVMEIAKYGVFGTPAVVVDGEVKSVGKVPEKEEIKSWIAKQG